MVCKPVLDEGFVKMSQLGGGVGFVYATESLSRLWNDGVTARVPFGQKPKV